MHQSENSISLLERIKIEKLPDAKPHSECVELIILPYYESLESIPQKENLFAQLNDFISRTDKNATIAILTSPIFANDFCSQLKNDIHLKLWIAIKLENPIESKNYLKNEHAALLVLTRYKESLVHTKTRIGYTYCPSCNKTTKDYGGKKHLYHEYGTLMSDVWRDITVDFNSYPSSVIKRLKDLFGIPQYKLLNVYDQRNTYRAINKKMAYLKFALEEKFLNKSQLINGDCLEQLKKIPDNSIDFCFADPPYNLNKKYENWNDGIAIQEYFEWCDKWLSDLARVLKPGRTLAILNIPQWCIRHFKHLNTILNYQDWIVWEGLSMPVRMIMPSHYSILCFSKGEPRPLPAFKRKINSILERKSIEIIGENFCVRSNCIKQRRIMKISDTKMVSNVWHDIHRLKHNSRRVDHPCQLPPLFMYRLISLFTNEGEFILDPFNGAGTTTLTAQQLKRNYIGIELSEYYHAIALHRHEELNNGLDPFRKINGDKPKAKNSPVERLKKQKYKVSKKILQLEIRNISKQIGHIPSIEEVKQYSQFPIEYFENYFISWGEATAAARTTGMTEYKNGISINGQLKLFAERKGQYLTLPLRKE